MKRIFIFLLALASLEGAAQLVQFPTTYGLGLRRVGGDTLSWIPSDTLIVPSSLIGRTHIARKGTTVYYWNGTVWTAISSGGSSWNLLGNAGTVDGTNFIGTTDNIPFNIRVNNQRAGRIDHLLFNTFFGYRAGNANTTGISNVAVGNQALFSNTTGGNNIGIGRDALYSNTTGERNIAMGVGALRNNSTGNSNVGIGHDALAVNTTGDSNSGFGFDALFSNTTGYNNTSTGFQSMFSNTTGYNNIANGHQALFGNTTGFENTVSGQQAMYTNTTGSSNTAHGLRSLYFNTTGSNNTTYGYWSMINNTTGSYNTALGNTTGNGITTGSNNTFLGARITGLAANLNNNVILADGAGISTSRKISFDSVGQATLNQYPGTFTAAQARVAMVGTDGKIYAVDTTVALGTFGGATPTLQQVTTAGNATTNDILITSSGGAFSSSSAFGLAKIGNDADSSSSGYLMLRENNGNSTIFGYLTANGLTARRAYRLPNASGTIALTSDIPSGGITSINTLTAATQTFATGTAGTDFAISSATSTHTFNLPTASASNRGALSTTDWSAFNNKQATGLSWLLAGNSVATGIGNFIGTTNDRSLRFATNSIHRMILDSAGRLGIGTVAPKSTFQVEGTVGVSVYTKSFGNFDDGINLGDFPAWSYIILDSFPNNDVIVIPGASLSPGRIYNISRTFHTSPNPPKISCTGCLVENRNSVLSAEVSLRPLDKLQFISDGTNWRMFQFSPIDSSISRGSILLDSLGYIDFAGTSNPGNVTITHTNKQLTITGGGLKLAAGTTTLTPMQLVSGTLNTTPAAGGFEYLTNTPYFTPTASNRAALVTKHYTSCDADVTLTNNTSLQSIFPAAQDAFTVAANTSYLFELVFSITNGSTSSGNDIAFNSGTCTFTSIYYSCVGKGSSTAFPSHLGTVVYTASNSAAATTISSTVITGLQRSFTVRGIMKINAGGTMIPMVSFSVAPTGTTLVLAGSYMTLTPIGTDTVIKVGDWN